MSVDWKRRRTLPTSCVRRVAIVGGTHGNETNGVYLARHFMRNPEVVLRRSFETEVFLSNTEAIDKNVRYVEEDLNRCFLASDLADQSKASTTKERKRAQEVDTRLGPKGASEPRCDLVIDLHNTTAATGVALLMAPDDDFAHELGHHLMGLDDDVRIVNWSSNPDWALCASVGRSGMTFEVGPCPWGVLVPDLFHQSVKLIGALLDYVDRHNSLASAGAAARSDPVTVPIYRALGVPIGFPRDADGDLDGMVHQAVHGRDFKELEEGDPLFSKFSGETVKFHRANYPNIPAGTKSVHALFVNEAAYYEKNVALVLVTRDDRKVTKLR